MLLSLTVKELNQVLEKKLRTSWEYFSKAILYKKDGLDEFESWLCNDGWSEAFTSKEYNKKYRPVIIIQSFREVRSLMIKQQLYLIRKKQIDALFHKVLQAIAPSTIEQLLKENSSWSSLLKQGIAGVNKEFSVTLPISIIQDFEPDLDNNVWLSQWLVKPHFQKYKLFIENLTDEMTKQKMIETCIAMLKKQTHHHHSKRVFFQIVSYHKKYDVGMNQLYLTIDPLHLSEEEEVFINDLIAAQHPKITSLLHQFIERLVEKKSRTHYLKAINYLTMLEKLYITKEPFFQEYLTLLMKKYSRYTSFTKELSNVTK
ncbi:hypothetical protein [Evansella tamaricis]|uniref:Uncharacterized protein n=1 Tax=Evansella tamaricis TaxID=2069301 RepID=A0ABS6JD31_9BACI|nr:hypothetical protein [Evansella tamaricis]MBU9711476.1 hypothetical protein [Evansella tamaricis]